MNLTIVAYLLNLFVFAIVFFVKGNKKYLIANNFLLACFAILELLFVSWELIIAFYSGYFEEMIEFYTKVMGYGYLIFILKQVVFWMLPFLNFKKKFRNKWSAQLIILILYFIPGILMSSGMLSIFGTETTNAIPGWHTFVYNINYQTYLLCSILFLLLNLLLVYFKVLPEFKKSKKDDLYDSLIDEDK